MLSREENELLTNSNSGTPAGEYFRRFWLPALLPAEVPTPDCPPVRVKLLGEDLIASATRTDRSVSSMSFVRTGVPAFSGDVTKSVACGACITAGNST